MTFPQTQTIIDGAVVSGISVDDIQTVLNLRDGWKFVINSVDATLTLEYICKINEYVSRNESLEWGVLRKGTVGVGDFIPSIPIKENVLKEIERIKEINSPIDRALEYFAYACKQQLFWDGNKRTSTMVASKILIENGQGILILPFRRSLSCAAGTHFPWKKACVISCCHHIPCHDKSSFPEQGGTALHCGKGHIIDGGKVFLF